MYKKDGRALPFDFDPKVVAAIDARLEEVERMHGARILLAIESGSRAWGFPSPDSDYDCRFIYVRHKNRYLSPWQPRDVIETPLDALLDVNGWDLGKALKLLLKGNAVIAEWLASPATYRTDTRFRAEMNEFADRFSDRTGIALHYLHLGERQYRTHFDNEKAVPLKRLFYVLRPAIALRWMRLHAAASRPPMHFPTLMAECAPPANLVGLVDKLLAAKAITKELGSGPLPPLIRDFVAAEFEAARTIFISAPRQLSPVAREAAETLFRRWADKLLSSA
ncbi:MAG: nucleotidyltransferase [Proteobacteria bacterium SG_bin6]|nr:MAG: nucleotidyltransferase [Proteobacteria bacterium SG_bin6]